MKKVFQVFQVDAFTSNVFGGNPASVVILSEWLTDKVMQQIASEHNQPETAFIVKNGNLFNIRWFTPICEVDLCGHATLASAFVIFTELKQEKDTIHFETKNRGPLYVSRKNDLYEMDFPADNIAKTSMPYGLVDAFDYEPLEVYRGKDDYLLVFKNEQQIIDMQPDFDAVASVEARGVICTAPGKDVDFVSRFFGPQSGIDEDPVTGSAHTTLVPYWNQTLGKTSFKARQLSARGGYLELVLKNDRVLISGSAVLYMKGEITL